ncbi:DUF998 domain-containing protein [Paenibacillus athensensis]|uniref:DUF998 domain-containing protein n=1 Tax=Paenibacillus athensensis TaxID=1967502 RepID=A0A4Y8Q2I9_9BACL|nr:DUF998 domain-containing protein [Paenibacillus athensensis]MCD1261121.1 DUF998 domain-containing protein [Paenibacillus athensensis]
MSEINNVTKPYSSISVSAAKLSILTSSLFIIILASLHVLEREFDPTWRFISEYALGKFGWLMHLCFYLIALSLVSIGIVIVSQLRSIMIYISLIILLMSATGLFIAGIFVTDPIVIYQNKATFSGQMHVLGASLDYTPIAAFLISLALVRHKAWQIVRTRLLVTSCIMLVLMFAFMFFLPRDGAFGPGVYAGLIGRFLIMSYYAWIVVVGFHFLKLSKRNTNTI